MVHFRQGMLRCDLRTAIVKNWNLLNLYLLIYLSGNFVY